MNKIKDEKKSKRNPEGRVVAVRAGLLKYLKSAAAAVLICQLWYWSDIAKGKWVYKTAKEMEDEIGLSYKRQKTAIKLLEAEGLLRMEKKGWANRRHFKIDKDKINEILERMENREQGKYLKPNVALRKRITDYLIAKSDCLDNELEGDAKSNTISGNSLIRWVADYQGIEKPITQLSLEEAEGIEEFMRSIIDAAMEDDRNCDYVTSLNYLNNHRGRLRKSAIEAGFAL